MKVAPSAMGILFGIAGCSAAEPAPTPAVQVLDEPIEGLAADERRAFDDGRKAFHRAFGEIDGLGPLFVRSSCSACHAGGARGPGLVQKMVVVEGDGFTPARDQSLLPWGSGVRLGLAAGATTQIVPPEDPRVKVTTRVGPPVFGRGYMEAIADADIERVAAEQAARTDGIHGHVNRVTFVSVPNPDATFGSFARGQTHIVGRFGLKARIAVLDEFTADAFQADMGLTTPMRPDELPNPDGRTDDGRPGVDLPLSDVDGLASYLRRIAIPSRVGLTAEGRVLFDRAKCSVCHVPSFRTRTDYPIAALAGVDAPVYTDMLVHDMGAALADGHVESSADARSWRTAPLIGLRFGRQFLHDGRARSVGDAILAHDGEGRAAVDAFHALSSEQQQALVRFVEAL